MARIYREGDVVEGTLEGIAVAVIGYGAQGHAQARMMQEGGLDIIVGVREGGPSFEQAKRDGIKQVVSIEAAVQLAQVIHILLPDEVHGEVYAQSIAPHLTDGKILSVCHGFSLLFKMIVPPKHVGVLLVAPKGPGTEIYKNFKNGLGSPALIAVEQSLPNIDVLQVGLNMAHAMHFTKAGVLQCTLREETVADLFGEQAVLCGGLSGLIKAGFETMVEAGYSPEMAYFECVHEVKLVVDLLFERGLAGMWDVISNTAEYGAYIAAPKLIDASVKERMQTLLKNIESGKFADAFLNEVQANHFSNVLDARKQDAESLLERTGKQLKKDFKLQTNENC